MGSRPGLPSLPAQSQSAQLSQSPHAATGGISGQARPARVSGAPPLATTTQSNLLPAATHPKAAAQARTFADLPSVLGVDDASTTEGNYRWTQNGRHLLVDSINEVGTSNPQHISGERAVDETSGRVLLFKNLKKAGWTQVFEVCMPSFS